jgi:hypothetical protein
MMNVCHQCGIYRVDKIVDPDGPYAICPECGYKHAFLYKPLLVVSGASGSGKTSVCHFLTGRVPPAVFLDGDILWGPAFDQPETQYRYFFETWLRFCKNLNQSTGPVVLFGAGFGVPDNLKDCLERRYLSEIHYLALVCSDEILAERLRGRPEWRGTRDPAYIQEHQRFNQWFKDASNRQDQPPIRVLDTSRSTVEETANSVEKWILERLE